jgi:hypothetical protein
MKSKGVVINPVNFGEAGEKETDPATSKPLASEYLNLRAEVYSGKNGVAVWIKSGGMLKPHKDWLQLTEVRYKKDSSGKTKIEPKEDMRKRGVESPDVADALALTFAKIKKYQYHSIDPAIILAGGIKPFFPGMPG